MEVKITYHIIFKPNLCKIAFNFMRISCLTFSKEKLSIFNRVFMSSVITRTIEEGLLNEDDK